MRRNRSVGLDFARPLPGGFGTTGGDGPEGALGCEGRMLARHTSDRPFGLSPAANCRYRLGHGLGSSARRRFCRVPVLIWPGIGLCPEAIAGFRPFASRHSPALAATDREFPALGLP